MHAIGPKTRILFLAANPIDTQPLRLDEEIREITAKIQAADYRDSLEIISWWAVKPDDLLQALNQYRPRIVHFSGHGNSSDGIILEGANGGPKFVSGKALTQLFRSFSDARLVLLNSCFSQVQAKSLARICGCAIGMSRAVGDKAAIVFAASFYRAIGFGRTIREAFEQAKTALMLEGIPEHGTPKIYCRRGVDLFALILREDDRRNEEERSLVEQLFTFLEDRRILFSKVWGITGFLSPGSLASIHAIRSRITADLQRLPRKSSLAVRL